jgi:hypothetical protein
MKRLWIRALVYIIALSADIFSFAHHAWASENCALGEGGEAESDFSWFRSELARLRFDLQGK